MMAGRSPETGTAGGPARHRPVALAEVLDALAPRDGAIYVDGTFGAGGYSRALLETADCRVVAIDRDPRALTLGADLARDFVGRLALVEGRFSDLDVLAAEAGAEHVDGVVLDVGVSSMQLDEAGRGFSFRAEGPLDMRMGAHGPSAADVVNEYEERDLAVIIGVLGEERRARAIARAIVRRRAQGAIRTTGDLVVVVESVLGRAREGRIHPATRTFQALRIHVNDELEELGRALGAAERVLVEGGRLVVVTFHSLEDRIVKTFLATRSGRTGRGSRHMPEAQGPVPTFEAPRKAIAPGAQEIEANPRARSAKLRAAIRTAASGRPVDLAEIGVPHLALTGHKGKQSWAGS